MDNRDKTQEIIDKLKDDLLNYEIFFNTSSEGFFIHKKGKFILANDAFLKIFGIDRKELHNYTLFDFLTEESIIKAKENMQKRYEGQYELTGVKKDGKKIYILLRVKEIIYRNEPARAVFVQDITEEKLKREEAITKQKNIEQQRKILVSLAKLGIKADINYENIVSNIIDIVYMSLNAVLGGFFVLADDNENLKSIGLISDFNTDDLLLSFKDIKDYVETRINIIEDENQIKKVFNNPKFACLSLIISPVRYEGEFIGLLLFGRQKEKKWERYEMDFVASVSDMVMLAFERWNRKLIEEEINAAMEQLKKLNRIKSDFISMISHELRTPLTSIMGFVSLLLKGGLGELNAQQMDFISSIENNSKRLLKLINDLLDISRIEKGKLSISKSEIDIIKLINNVLSEMSVILELKKIKITKNYEQDNIIISGDSSRLSQVITNVIDNAIKYSKTDIEIKISVKKIKGVEVKNDNIRQMILPDCQYALIGIKDNGIGIVKENLEKIFNMFTQLESIDTRRHSGIGLGLYIASQIIKEHNGFIWAESEGEGKGTLFNILLPFD